MFNNINTPRNSNNFTDIKAIVFILAALFTNSFSQNSKIETYFDTIVDDAEIFLIDAYSYYTYPLSMSECEWAAAAGFGIGTYFLVHHDDDIRTFINEPVDRYNNNFWNIFEKYAVVQYAELLGVGTYAIGLLGENKNVRVLGRMIVQSLTYSGLTAMLIRMTAGRKRPLFTNDPMDFIGFTSNNDYQSFPSGHTTVAFALSTVLAEYINTPLSRITFYSIAGLTAVERIINSQHWFSDVLLGSSLGIISALHVLNEEKSRNSPDKSRLTIQPSLNGISLKYRLN